MELNKENINNIKREVKRAIKAWINTHNQAEDQFYPLHYASFHGNVKLLKLLIKNGADI